MEVVRLFNDVIKYARFFRYSKLLKTKEQDKPSPVYIYAR